MPGTPSCGLGGSSNTSGPCTGTYSLSSLPSSLSGLQGSAVVRAFVAGAAIYVAVGFALFAVYVVARIFSQRRKAAAARRAGDVRAEDKLYRSYYRNFDMEDFGQRMADAHDDAEDSDEDDTPEDAEFSESHS
ncbi:MAG: hypothetical protein WA777_10760 [Rhodanobacter sp.]